MSESLQQVFAEYGLEQEFLHVARSSPYVLSVFTAQTERLKESLNSGRWQHKPEVSRVSFTQFCESDDFTELEFKSLIRRFRNFYSAHILWHDLLGSLAWRDLFFLQSELADVCMQVALQYVQSEFDKKYQRPKDAQGNDLELCVVAMGKWGGQELNFSSDIDYLYLFAENGEVENLTGTRSLAHQQYFLKQAQKINQLLDDITGDGFVYRCDTRLRPFGDSGPLVVSLSALEQYLLQHGREWERYAYLKARCVTGDEHVRSGFAELRRPFVYRRYLDYGVFANLREMHEQISSQVKKKQIEDNIKLGRGGIRECEFLVQAYQLIRGGREPELQQSNFFDAYKFLCDKEVISDVGRKFVAAYTFHRLIENRLQGLHQKQTHILPHSDVDRECLVHAMGFENWQSLMTTWNQHRQVVADKFSEQVQLFKTDVEQDASYVTLLDAELAKLKSKLELIDQDLEHEVVKFRESSFYLRYKDDKKRLLDKVLVNYFQYINQELEDGNLSINKVLELNRRFLRVLTAIGQRQTYFSLLAEHQQALQNLVTVCTKSEFISLQVSQHPVLLDELLDMHVFQSFPSMDSVREDVLTLSSQIKVLDTEEFLQQLIDIRNAQVFRIAVADAVGGLSIMKVSDCLTVLAESILSVVLDYVNYQALKKYKLPEIDWRDTGFMVIAYGKLGGLELAYSSDLDIVFLADDTQIPPAHPLASDKGLCGQYYHRVAQQCIRILDMPTVSGRLYEVDTRLRPNGHSGFLVGSIEAFEKYQAQEAWVWEHQALTRARAILGSQASRRKFETIRENILQNHVALSELKDKVTTMRDKMRGELDNLADENLFHLKHSRGGMIDIEFLVQYLVLAHAKKYPNLTVYSDNVRQLEAVEKLAQQGKKILEVEQVESLIQVYLSLRDQAHALGLDNRATVVARSDIEAETTEVSKIWKLIFTE